MPVTPSAQQHMAWSVAAGGGGGDIRPIQSNRTVISHTHTKTNLLNDELQEDLQNTHIYIYIIYIYSYTEGEAWGLRSTFAIYYWAVSDSSGLTMS